MSASHLLVRASAGTGKTYALTTRYIERLLDGARPEGLLATTFTRKAAREILERVLTRLADAAVDEWKRAELARDTQRAITGEHCVALLGGLVRHFDRVRIGTLDAFFVELAGGFALELGLPADWRIADENEDADLTLDAIARALDRAGDVEWLALLRDLQSARAESGVHAALAKLLTNGLHVYLESAADAWERVVPTPAVSSDALAEGRRRLAELDLPRTNAGTPNRNWQKARDKCLDLVEREDWEGLLASESLFARICEGGTEFSSKPILPEHCAAFEPFIGHVVHLRTKSVALQNRAARELFARLDRAYRALQGERGLFRFDDLTRVVSDRDGSLWPRLGGRIDHLLLDEFQDTSPVQWRTIAPLADEIVASRDGKKSFFCVGDVKQSIYGWREAEPRLMQSLEARYPVLELESLTKSFRSSSVVLDVVNSVFSGIASNPAFARKNIEAELAAANDFQATYETHAAAKDLAGSVTLWEVPRSEKGERDPPIAIDTVVERVTDALVRGPERTIAVLVRSGKHIPALIHRLQRQGIAASGEGGNPLTDSAAVQVVVSLFHWADHPGDSAAAFHVATSVFAPFVGMKLDDTAEARATIARRVRATIERDGLGAYVFALVEGVRGRVSAFDQKRLAALVDLALGFESRAPFRTSAFVDHVRHQPVEDPGASQVKVMTVHKAKGLEFDVVVLPELSSSMRRSSDRLWTERGDPAARIEIATHTTPEIVAERHDVLRRLAAEQRRRDVQEELCVLYVAMTRAIHELHMIIPAEKEDSDALSLAAILRGALAPGREAVDGKLWHEHRESADRARAPAAPPRRPRERAHIQFRRASAAPVAEARSPSSEVHHEANAFALLRVNDRALSRGKLIHRWLAEVEWLETFRASDADLQRLVRSRAEREDVVREALAGFRAGLEQPDVRGVLARESQRATKIEVWRERRFAVMLEQPDGGEAPWSGAFDRVHLVHEQGRLASALIVDFKTGGDPAQYAPQMDAYRRVLAKMTALDPGSIETRVVVIGP